jgi:hypothetical protein
MPAPRADCRKCTAYCPPRSGRDGWCSTEERVVPSPVRPVGRCPAYEGPPLDDPETEKET